MGGGRLARIGKVANQKECDDGAYARPCSAHTTNGGNGFTLEEIGGQYVRDGRKRGVGKSRQREQDDNCPQLERENRWNQKKNAEATKDHQRLPRRTKRPAAFD